MNEADKPSLTGKPITLAAQILSYVFNPLLMPLWAFLMLFSLQTYFSMIIPFSAKRMLLSVVAVNTTILPLLTILMLKRLGLISSLDLDKREERLYPLLLGLVMYSLTYYLFRKLNLPQVYISFLLGAGFVVAGGLVVSLYYKISIHMAAMGGLFGLCLILEVYGLELHFGWLVFATLAAGLTGTARLILHAHTPPQVYLGFLMGTGLMTLAFFL